jgi:hypothetical protein
MKSSIPGVFLGLSLQISQFFARWPNLATNFPFGLLANRERILTFAANEK